MHGVRADTATATGTIGPNAVIQLSGRCGTRISRSASSPPPVRPSGRSIRPRPWSTSGAWRACTVRCGPRRRGTRRSVARRGGPADCGLHPRQPNPTGGTGRAAGLPVPVAGRLLVSAIRAHAWTFAGSARFAAHAGAPTVFTLTGNPLCGATGGSARRRRLFAPGMRRVSACSKSWSRRDPGLSKPPARPAVAEAAASKSTGARRRDCPASDARRRDDLGSADRSACGGGTPRPPVSAAQIDPTPPAHRQQKVSEILTLGCLPLATISGPRGYALAGRASRRDGSVRCRGKMTHQRDGRDLSLCLCASHETLALGRHVHLYAGRPRRGGAAAVERGPGHAREYLATIGDCGPATRPMTGRNSPAGATCRRRLARSPPPTSHPTSRPESATGPTTISITRCMTASARAASIFTR